MNWKQGVVLWIAIIVVSLGLGLLGKQLRPHMEPHTTLIKVSEMHYVWIYPDHTMCGELTHFQNSDTWEIHTNNGVAHYSNDGLWAWNWIEKECRP